MSTIAVNADDVATFATLADPDAGDNSPRYVSRLAWRLFLEALNPVFPSFKLEHIIHRFARDPHLGEHVLSDGSLCRDNVEPGINHAGWLTILACGSKQYDRNGNARRPEIEAARLRGALELHELFFGAIGDCAECTRARASQFDAVIPYEIADVERLALVPA